MSGVHGHSKVAGSFSMKWISQYAYDSICHVCHGRHESKLALPARPHARTGLVHTFSMKLLLSQDAAGVRISRRAG